MKTLESHIAEYLEYCEFRKRLNNKTLKGNEIITGGNIIIPIDIKVLETTISITKKGI